jgi:1,3-beta-glucanosyltransferase GAS1
LTNKAVTNPNGTDAAPYVKAAVRDTKAYMKSKGGRYVPLGYSAADIASIRPMFQNYLVCGPLNETIDFFAVNIYEWVVPHFGCVNSSVEIPVIKLQAMQIV